MKDFNLESFFSEFDSLNLGIKDTDKEPEIDKQYKPFQVQELKENNALNRNGKTVKDIMNIYENSILHHNAIQRSALDLMIFEDNYNFQFQCNKASNESISKIIKQYSPFLHFMEDLFFALYKYQPILNNRSSLHASVQFNYDIIHQLIHTNQFLSIRKACRLDQFYSIKATFEIAKKVVPLFINKLADIIKANKKEELDELIEKEEKIDTILEEMDELIEEEEILESKDSKELLDLKREIEILNQNLEKEMKKAESNSDSLDGFNFNFMKELLDCITDKTNVNNCVNEIQKDTLICQLFGLGEGQSLQIPMEQKREAYIRIKESRRLQKMINEIGRFKETVSRLRKEKVKIDSIEIASITTGNKIEDIIPTERIYLCNERLKNNFHVKMADNSLMIYEKKAKGQKNKGPIIVCVDTSGSMSGSKETYSKAFTIATLDIAQSQRRNFACIIYSSNAREPIFIKKDEIAPDKVIQIAEDFLNGGTDFEEPLEKSLKVIEDSEFKKADILFVTDGQAKVSTEFLKEFLKRKEEKEFYVYGILISPERISVSLNSFCDTVVNINPQNGELASDSISNLSIFESLMKGH